MQSNSVRAIWGNNLAAVWLRHTFTLSHRPQKAVLRLYADTGYELFLNGRFVAAVDEWCNTRDYDVRPWLTAGDQCVAIHAMNHAGHRGVSFELAVDGETILVSDASWRASDRARWGWTATDYDDSGWAFALERDFSAAGCPQWSTRPGSDPAKIIPALDCSPFFLGAIPKVVESPFFGKRAVSAPPLPEAAARILGDGYEKARRAVPAALIPMKWIADLVAEYGEISQNGNVIHIHAPEYWVGPAAVVDFGEEAVGYLRFRTRSEKPVRFRLTYAETLDECYSRPSRDQLQHRMLTEEGSTLPGEQEFESHLRNGFRFARVEFYDCAAPVALDSLQIVSSIYPVSYQGYFESSDPLLNRIWTAGRKTLHLCMQEYYLDGIKRDRFLWVGDTRMEALINYYLFADTELFRFCWTEVARVQYPDGAIPSAYGQGCSIIWDYVAWWIIAFHDYYLFTGDAAFPVKFKDQIVRATDWLASKAGADGLIDVPANPAAPLWMVTLNNIPGHDPLMNEVYLRSLETARETALLAGDQATAAHFGALIEITAPAVAKLLAAHPVADDKTQHHNATGAYEGVEFLANEGKIDRVLAWIRDQWGAILESGADTLFEGLYLDKYPRIDERHPGEPVSYISNCHGWTGGPCVTLAAGVAGIKPLKPGFTEFECKPQPGDLAWFRAACPTPHGLIAVAWEAGTLTIVVPPGTTAQVELPGRPRRSFAAGEWKIN